MNGSISWRARAEEYRIFADAAKDAQVRAGYLQLARHCDSLAERQEQMQAGDPKGGDKPSQQFG